MATRRIVPNENGNISHFSVNGSRSKLYRDVDLSFTTKPGSGGVDGDIYKKTDVGAILQAVRTILLTNRYEKPFQPLFGSDIYSRLFEMTDSISEQRVIESISRNISAFEPRVNVLDVEFSRSSDGLSIELNVVLQIQNLTEPVTFTTKLNRLR
jgi:phage baseplate assembly protein W